MPRLALSIIASNAGERWLISMTLIPLPSKDKSSLCARSKTSTGRMAGPALKLKILSADVFVCINRSI
jgi:hypothetical protein